MTVVGVAAIWNAALAASPVAKGDTGFTSSVWTDSELMDYIRGLPTDAPLFSNAPDAIYIATGRFTWAIPSEYDAWSLVPNTSLETEINAMARELSAVKGAVVIFTDIRRPYLVRLGSLLQLPIKAERATPDGVLFVSR